jgi:hypothetical protein
MVSFWIMANQCGDFGINEVLFLNKSAAVGDDAS